MIRINQKTKNKNIPKNKPSCLIFNYQYNTELCISKFIEYEQITSYEEQKKFKQFIKTNYHLGIKKILGEYLDEFDLNNTHNQLILAIMLLSKNIDYNNFITDWVEYNHYYKCVCPMCSLAHLFQDKFKLSSVESFISAWIIMNDPKFNNYAKIYRILARYKYSIIKRAVVYDKIVENQMWFGINKNSIINIQLNFEKYTTTAYKIRNFIKCNHITKNSSRLPPEIIDIIIGFI